MIIEDHGTGNTVDIATDTYDSIAGRLVLRGNNNRVVIGERCTGSEQLYIELGSDSSFDVGTDCTLGHLFVHAAREAYVEVGPHAGFNGQVRLLLHEPGRISIGHGCLFAGNVEVSVSDMHSVIDVPTGRRINPPADVEIAPVVWIAQGVTVLKGAKVGRGSVIGAAAVVRGTIPEYSLAVGVPARVVRTDTTWSFDLKPWDNDEPVPERRPVPAGGGLLQSPIGAVTALRSRVGRMRHFVRRAVTRVRG